jgi:hypothetical protein
MGLSLKRVDSEDYLDTDWRAVAASLDEAEAAAKQSPRRSGKADKHEHDDDDDDDFDEDEDEDDYDYDVDGDDED